MGARLSTDDASCRLPPIIYGHGRLCSRAHPCNLGVLDGPAMFSVGEESTLFACGPSVHVRAGLGEGERVSPSSMQPS